MSPGNVTLVPPGYCSKVQWAESEGKRVRSQSRTWAPSFRNITWATTLQPRQKLWKCWAMGQVPAPAPYPAPGNVRYDMWKQPKIKSNQNKWTTQEIEVISTLCMLEIFTRARVSTFDSLGPSKWLIKGTDSFSLLSLTPLIIMIDKSRDAPIWIFLVDTVIIHVLKLITSILAYVR